MFVIAFLLAVLMLIVIGAFEKWAGARAYRLSCEEAERRKLDYDGIKTK